MGVMKAWRDGLPRRLDGELDGTPTALPRTCFTEMISMAVRIVRAPQTGCLLWGHIPDPREVILVEKLSKGKPRS